MRILTKSFAPRTQILFEDNSLGILTEVVHRNRYIITRKNKKLSYNQQGEPTNKKQKSPKIRYVDYKVPNPEPVNLDEAQPNDILRAKTGELCIYIEKTTNKKFPHTILYTTTGGLGTRLTNGQVFTNPKPGDPDIIENISLRTRKIEQEQKALLEHHNYKPEIKNKTMVLYTPNKKLAHEVRNYVNEIAHQNPRKKAISEYIYKLLNESHIPTINNKVTILINSENVYEGCPEQNREKMDVNIEIQRSLWNKEQNQMQTQTQQITTTATFPNWEFDLSKIDKAVETINQALTTTIKNNQQIDQLKKELEIKTTITKLDQKNPEQSKCEILHLISKKDITIQEAKKIQKILKENNLI